MVNAHAIRKVSVETGDTGAAASSRVHTDLTIKVKSTFFDPVISTLRISGTVSLENDTVARGQHHTLEIEPQRSLAIIKPEGWDSVAKAALNEALSDDKNGALAAVVMQEGLANICLITQFRTVLKTRVESPVPKKRDAASEQDAGRNRFFEKVLQTLTRAVDFSDSRPLLLASPGFVATDFKAYIAKQGRDKNNKILNAVAELATVIHANSGHLHSLNEVLKSPEVLAKMKDMKFSREAQYVENFFDLLKLDDGRAWYGSKAVEKAVEDGAVGSGARYASDQQLTVPKSTSRNKEKVRRDSGQGENRRRRGTNTQ